MKLKDSIHVSDAAWTIANHALHSMESYNAMMQRHARKWRLAKTLVYTALNGLKYNYYLDKDNRFVCISRYYYDGIAIAPVTIGEVEEVTERPERE